ncbi:MAG: hypothetical protein ACRCWG_03115 [Sarcina sp.]
MMKMSKSEFVKKFINDTYNDKFKQKQIKKEIDAYDFVIINKNRFR